MRKNENGFTYPLTLMVLLLFLTIFSVRVEQLVIERKVAHEKSIILLQEYYFHTSIKKVENLYQTSAPLPSMASIVYLKGTMDYQTEKPVGTLQKINFTLRLNSGEIMTGRGYYDTNLKRLVKWIE